MSHIFISYNQSDADFAAVLSIQIEKAGIDTWMDKSRLRPGQDWSVEIDGAIINSHALIVIMSPEAKASEYVTYEWSFALGAEVRVIPVLYKETTLHPRLARLQYLKFTDTFVRPWDVLIETVKEAVDKSSVYVVRLPRDAPPHVKSAVVALDSANDGDREGAIRVLAQTDHPAARQTLLSALQHPIRSVRWDAALHVSDDTRAVTILVDAFLNKSASHTGEGCEQYALRLADFGSSGMDALIELLKTAGEHECIERSLARLKEGEAIPALVHLLHDPVPEIRRRAASALAHHPSALVEQELVNSLQDTDKDVRRVVIDSLRNQIRLGGSYKCWDGLLIGLEDISWLVRRAVAVNYLKDPPDFFKQKLLELAKGQPLTIALAAHRVLMQVFSLKLDPLIEDGLIGEVNKDVEIGPGAILWSEKDYYLVLRRRRIDIEACKLIENDNKVLFELTDTTYLYPDEESWLTNLYLEIAPSKD